VVISDGGSHFCNAELKKAFAHFWVQHRIATTYHPQTNGPIEVSNKEVREFWIKQCHHHEETGL